MSVPLSAINKLRRDAFEKISTELLEKNTPVNTNNFNEKTEKLLKIKSEKNSRKTYLFFSREEQIFENIPNDFIIVLPLKADEKVCEKLILEGQPVSAEMPRGIFSRSEEVRKKAEKLINIGVKRFFCPTLDSAVIAKELGAEITASYGSNIFNSYSLDVWKNYFADEAILSTEMTVSQINRLRGEIKTGIICYGKLPLMLTRNCPVKSFSSCTECGGKGKLTDRKGYEFSVDCSSGTSEILNSMPLYIFDRLSEFKNIDFCVLKFTTESKEECKKITDKYLRREKSEDKFTRGLYYRGVI